MAFEVWIGPVIIAAGIAGMVNVLGWFVASWRDRRSDDRRREEKRSDLSTALLAEITHYRDALDFFDLDDVWESVVSEMENDENYVPFVPSERNDTIFRAILGDIHILPEPVIQPVTRYYNQVFAIDAIITDLRSDTLRQEAQRKRIAAYTDYISLKKEALAAAELAITTLQTHLSISGARPSLTRSGGAR